MNDLDESRQMQGLEPIVQAKRAIFHTLSQIHERPAVGWYLGGGTQTFALLTEAAATLASEPITTIRDRFACKEPKNPAESTPADGGSFDVVEEMVASDVTEYLESMASGERMMLLHELRARFCFECGGDDRVRVGPCSCRQFRSPRRFPVR